MNRLPVILLLALMLPVGLPAAAQEEALSVEQVAAAADEQLLFQAIPTVFTASKKEQLATQSPSSVTVITQEDVRRSGATSIPDLLRRVVGADIFQETASQWEVNLRGLAQALNSRTLVLIDGRTVYSDIFGGAVWYLLPVVLEDIERIEVVRGPGSALYGANAFSGVINIITRSVASAAGTTISVTRGAELQRNALVYGNATASLPYKITAGYDTVDEWNRDVRSGQVGKFTFLIEPPTRGRTTASFGGGLTQGNTRIRFSLIDPVPMRVHDQSKYLMGSFENGTASVRAFWNHSDQNIDYTVDPRPGPFETDVLDLEIQTNRDWGRHSAIMGTGARHTTVRATPIFDAPAHTERLVSLFVQDEYRAGPQLTLVAGARYDRTNLLGGRLSPRLAALYRLTAAQSLRLSVGQAFRRPTFLESFMWLGQEFQPGLNYVLHGNRRLNPEVLRSLELEYRANFDRVKLTAEAYRYRIDGFVMDTRLSGEPPLIEDSIDNLLDVRASGLELSADYLISPQFSGFANAAWERTEDRSTGRDLDGVPGHKLNAGLRFTGSRGLQADLYVHHVANTRWVYDYDPEETPTPAYTIVNARLAQLVSNDDLSLAFSVFNLLNDRHQEFPDAPRIGRRVAVTALYRF